MRCMFVEIPGRPVPQGRPRFGQGRAYDPKPTKAWKDKARKVMLLRRGLRKPLSGPIAAEIVYLYSGKPEGWMANVPDLDNLEKATLDAASGILYADDRAVAAVNKTKLWTPKGARVLFHVSEIGSISVPFGLPRQLCACWTEKGNTRGRKGDG